MCSVSFCFIGIKLEGAQLNWQNWSLYLILVEVLQASLLNCIIFCLHSHLYKDACANSFFTHTVRLRNSLPVCVSMKKNLNCVKFLVYRHLQALFNQLFAKIVFLVMPCLVVVEQTYMESTQMKKNYKLEDRGRQKRESKSLINLNILNCENNGPKGHKKPAASGKLFAFCDAIIAYHYLSTNPKLAMETVN